jgi:hypothetical protein
MTAWHCRLWVGWAVKRAIVHAKVTHFQIKRCCDIGDKFTSERIAGVVAQALSPLIVPVGAILELAVLRNPPP